jgi:hypothetical protein
VGVEGVAKGSRQVIADLSQPDVAKGRRSPVGVLMRLVRTLVYGVATSEERFRLVQKYVDYVIREKPSRTAVSMISERIPNTSFKMYQGEILNVIEALQEQMAGPGGSRHLWEALGYLREIVERKVEPETGDWINLKQAIDWALDTFTFDE